MLAGNHDHGIAAGWIDARLQSEPSGFLGLEQRFAPEEAGPLAQRLARGRTRPRGCSSPTPASGCATTSTRSTATTPTCTRRSRPSSAWPRARWRATSPSCRRTGPRRTTTRPSSARSTRGCTRSRSAPTTRSSASAAAPPRSTYTKLTAKDRHKRPFSTLALNTGYRAAVAALNLAGLGPLEASLSPSALRRGYLHGHPRGDRAPRHRRRARDLGPLAPLRPVARGRPGASGPRSTGARILNTGSWVYQPHFLTPEPNRSPYWPGTAVEVDDDGPPRLVRLLGERSHEELRPRRHARGEAGGVDGHARRRLRASAARRCATGCSTTGKQPGSLTSTTSPLTSSSPEPSTTTQTPPAS